MSHVFNTVHVTQI